MSFIGGLIRQQSSVKMRACTNEARAYAFCQKAIRSALLGGAFIFGSNENKISDGWRERALIGLEWFDHGKFGTAAGSRLLHRLP